MRYIYIMISMHGEHMHVYKLVFFSQTLFECHPNFLMFPPPAQTLQRQTETLC